jgi:osmotically-inducible protein OsmY
MRSRKVATFLCGAAIGVAGEYLLDPVEGKRRRQMARDRGMAIVRRGAREAGRSADHVVHRAKGVAAEATPPGRDAGELNDSALKAKVESELFRPAEAPKGSVDLNVEEHVVVLHGRVGSEEQLEDLVERARLIDGVRDVESRLQVAG